MQNPFYYNLHWQTYFSLAKIYIINDIYQCEKLGAFVFTTYINSSRKYSRHKGNEPAKSRCQLRQKQTKSIGSVTDGLDMQNNWIKCYFVINFCL